MKNSILILLLISFSVEYIFCRQFKLFASDGEGSDNFGYSTDLDGNYLIVGAPNKQDFGFNSGAAYIFKYNGSEWIEEAKLLASDTLSFNEFGYSVSIDNDYAVIGARVNYTGAGAAYVFKRNGTQWNEEFKITEPCTNCNDFRFGQSVDLNGDKVIIGAYNSTETQNDAGIAYIFKRNGSEWIKEETLIPSDADIGDSFGWSVALYEDYAIVGAPHGVDSTGQNKGTAYIFKYNGTNWEEIIRLGSDDPVPNGEQYFGWSVTINNNYAAAGTLFSHMVFMFRKNIEEWVHHENIIPEGNTPGSTTIPYFGRSILIFDNEIIIGAPGSGAYLYRNNLSEWNHFAKVEPDSSSYNQFGTSVSITEDFIAAGDPIGFNDDPNHTGPGAVYVYDKNTLVGIDDLPETGLKDFSLYQNYPNPFNPSTVISWQLPVSSHVSLKIFDILGNEIATLVNEEKSPGNYQIEFEGSSLSSGIYFYRLSAGNFMDTKKLILIK